MIHKIESNSAGTTEALAKRLAKNLRGGEVIELTSDLGGGKTTFVRGLAAGIGSKDNVASPTFTINRLYEGTKLNLQHFDFYRLPEAGLMTNELAEVIDDPKNIVVIEWAEIVDKVLPKTRLTINLLNQGDDRRNLQFNCPESLEYLMKDLEE